VERKIRDNLESYAKPLCRKLCADVCKRLPREVRDMIYDFIHPYETIYVGPEYFQKTTPPCETDPDAFYWDADYVGDLMQGQIVESWYRSTCFYFYDKARNAQVIEQFLVTDRWGLSLKPRDLICRVRLELSTDNKIHHGKSGWNSSPDWRHCNMRNAATNLTRPLKNLDKLPNHVQFFVRIHTYGAMESGCLGKDELKNIIKVLVNKLKDLHTGGHRFILQWPELGNFGMSSKAVGSSTEEWTRQLEESARLL
jgi:hypothetical protein